MSDYTDAQLQIILSEANRRARIVARSFVQSHNETFIEDIAGELVLIYFTHSSQKWIEVYSKQDGAFFDGYASTVFSAQWHSPARYRTNESRQFRSVVLPIKGLGVNFLRLGLSNMVASLLLYFTHRNGQK